MYIRHVLFKIYFNPVNMFGGKKRKVKSAIINATKDAIGSDFNVTQECKLLSGNETVSAFLYTEIMTQKLYFLVFILDRLKSKYSFITWDFVRENIIQGIKENCKQGYMPDIMINGIIRLMEIKGTGPERITAMFQDSINLAATRGTVDDKKALAYFEQTIDNWMQYLSKYFSQLS
jgi:hypothetical protein